MAAHEPCQNMDNVHRSPRDHLWTSHKRCQVVLIFGQVSGYLQIMYRGDI
jgi:hypothetical protein